MRQRCTSSVNPPAPVYICTSEWTHLLVWILPQKKSVCWESSDAEPKQAKKNWKPQTYVVAIRCLKWTQPIFTFTHPLKHFTKDIRQSENLGLWNLVVIGFTMIQVLKLKSCWTWAAISTINELTTKLGRKWQRQRNGYQMVVSISSDCNFGPKSITPIFKRPRLACRHGEINIWMIILNLT